MSAAHDRTGTRPPHGAPLGGAAAASSTAAVTAGAWIAAAIGIFVMGWIVVTVVVRGIGAWNLAFFTQLPPTATDTGGGLANCIIGTLVITFGAAIVGLPLGFFGAIYLSEFGRAGRVATGIRAVTNIVLGVPSIIAGMFAYAILVLPSHHFSGFSASVALAFIMLPVMTRTAEDILNLVPNELRESALAMGAPRWKATLGVVVKAARGGLITGAILAVVQGRRRDRAAAVHGPQQPVLDERPVRLVGLLRRPHAPTSPRPSSTSPSSRTRI